MSTIRGYVMLFVATSLWFPWEYTRHWDYPGQSHITWAKTSVTSVDKCVRVCVCVSVCVSKIHIPFLCSLTRWEDFCMPKQGLCVCVRAHVCVPASIMCVTGNVVSFCPCPCVRMLRCCLCLVHKGRERKHCACPCRHCTNFYFTAQPSDVQGQINDLDTWMH